MWDAIRRQFHEQGMLALVASNHLDHPSHGERADDAGDIQGEQHNALKIENAGDGAIRNESRDQQRVYRQTCRTGHQRRNQDRGQAITRILDAARRHDAGNRAGETRQQWNKRAPGQASLEHHPIEQEGRTRQIAGFLQHKDEQKQDQDLQDNAIDGVVNRGRASRHAHRIGDHRAHFGMQVVADISFNNPRQFAIQSRDQGRRSAATHGDCLDNRNPQCRFKLRHIYGDATLAGMIKQGLMPIPSATQTIASGARSPGKWPRQTSRVITSSGLAASRL